MQKPLNPHEQWMVSSNIQAINDGKDPADLIRILKDGGYHRVAAGVEAAIRTVLAASSTGDQNMMATQIGLSTAASDKIVELANEAHRTEGWMVPVADAHCDDDDKADYGQWAMSHRAGWEQTCQYEMLWLARITTISEDDAEAQGVPREDDWEAWFYNFQCDAKDLFWETWESAHNLYAFWEKNVKP